MPLWLILFSLSLGCRLREAIVTTPGLPLTILRSYDSSNTREGDFGAGWTMAVNDLDVEMNENRSETPIAFSNRSFSMRTGGGWDVTLTLPDGRRTTFMYELTQPTGGDFKYLMKWVAEPGVTAKLTTPAPGSAEQLGDNVIVAFSGGFQYWHPGGPDCPVENYDIPKFILTLQDDTKYFIERENLDAPRRSVEIEPGKFIGVQAFGKFRVTKIERPNGEYLLISKNGIDHYLPGSSAPTRSLYFDRGVGNRIVAVRDAQDQSAKNTPMVRYEYDAAGNLVYVHKLQSKSGNGSDAKYATTTYVYGKPEFPHFISEVRDPRGIPLARNEYYPPGDANAGKLKSVTDAKDRTTSFEHDFDPAHFETSAGFGPAAAREEIKFLPVAGQPESVTVHETDQRGNVVFSKDPNGHVTLRQFDSSANVLTLEQWTESLESNRTYQRNWVYENPNVFSPTLVTAAHATTAGTILRVTRYEYDINGQVTKLFEPNHEQSGEAYHQTDYSAGQPTAEWFFGSDPGATSGKKLSENSYFPSNDPLKGLLSYTVDALNTATIYEYFGDNAAGGRFGDLKSVTVRENVNPANPRTTGTPLSKTGYTYDLVAGDRLTEERVKFQRDGSGTVQVDGNGAPLEAGRFITRYEYDSQHRAVKTIDPTLATSETVYNSLGKTASTTDRYGATTSYSYDKAGELSRTVYPDNTLVHQTTYYENGLRCVIMEDKHFPLTGSQKSTGTRTTYDKAGRAIKSERLKAITITATIQGEVCDTVYNTAQPATVLARTRTAYYDDGRVLDVTEETNLANGTGLVTSYTYSGDGMTKTITLPNVMEGSQTVVTEVIETINQSGNLLTTQTQSRTGVTEEAAKASAALDFRPVTKHVYDQLNRRKETWSYPDEIKAAAQTDGTLMSATEYDWSNRPHRETDADTFVKRLDYNGAGNLTGVVLAEGTADSTTTTYKYDEFDQQISQTDANSHITSFSFDGLGRRLTRKLPNALTESWTHDFDQGAGQASTADKRPNKIRHIDFNKQSMLTVNDIAGRVDLKRKLDSGVWVTFTDFDYTAVGQRSRMRDNMDSSARETRYVYDDQNRLVIKNTPAGTLTYTYDSGGNLAIISARTAYNFPAEPPYDSAQVTVDDTDASHAHMEYQYDTRHRLSFVNKDAQSADAAYTYGPVGSLATLKYRNGLLTTYTYNTRNQLVVMGNSLASYKYHDDAWPAAEKLSPSGRRNRLDESVNSVARTINYGYDSLQRLKQENMAAGTPSGTITYDSVPGYSDLSEGWGFDRVGNRRTRSVALTPAVLGLADAASDYTDTDRIMADNYDNNGNTTASGGKTYTYDRENRLISETGGAAIVYDGDGHRVKKTVGSTSIYFLVDDRNPTGYAKVIEERSAPDGAPTKVYVIGSSLISQTDSSSTSYYGYDGHGSVRYLTSASGVITDTYDYDAFGVLIGRRAMRTSDNTLVAFEDPRTEAGPPGAQPVANFYRFAGEQWDTDLGIYYNLARYYDPNTGRFRTMDSFDGFQSDPLSLHKYLYANASPVNFTDPTGKTVIADVLSAIYVRTVVFSFQHPALAGAIGLAINLLVPDEIDQALIATGIPGFQGLSAIRRGEVRFMKAIKNSRVSKYITHQALGLLSRETGDAFEVFIGKLLIGAKRHVATKGNNTIDFDWRGRLIELKTKISIIGDEGDMKQLRSAAQAAKETKKTLVYIFLERPTKGTVDEIVKKGGHVVHLFDR